MVSIEELHRSSKYWQSIIEVDEVIEGAIWVWQTVAGFISQSSWRCVVLFLEEE
jgi:hypothetical protein